MLAMEPHISHINNDSVLRIIISYLLINLGSNELNQDMKQVCKLFRDQSPYNKRVRTAGADALETVKHFLLTQSWGAKQIYNIYY